MAQERLYLVDGANLFFRAFYAIRPLSTSRGLPTNALYGFTRMLLKLIREERPSHLAVCLDTEEPTFRDELFDQYKANRKAPPDEIVAQFPYIGRLVEALGIRIVAKPGFEADDLIGTLTRRAVGEGMPVTIVSSDKDLMQLIGDKVEMLDEMKGVRIGPKEVVEKFGVGPEGVVELLSLAGDASDNVPGVSGVGPKTASKLIAQYGSVEEVLKHVREIGGALGERLKRGADSAALSRKLVTVDTNVPLKLDLKELAYASVDRKKVGDLFQELEFAKLLEELAPQEAEEAGSCPVICEETAVEDIVKQLKLKKEFSIIAFGDGPDPMRSRLIGLCLGWGEDQAAYLPMGHCSTDGAALPPGDLFAAAGPDAPRQLTPEKVFAMLGPLLADPAIRKHGHDLNPTLTRLASAGVELRGIGCDAMLASYCLRPEGDHTLEGLALAHAGLRLPDPEELFAQGKKATPPAAIAPERVAALLGPRARACLKLCARLRPRLEEEGVAKLFDEIETPLIEVLVAMQAAGVKVDIGRLAQIGSEFQRELTGLEARIHQLGGGPFNINSPKQLAQILFEKLKLRGTQRTKTGFSTSQEVLEELSSAHELPALVLRWRSLGKLKSTYVDALPQLVNPRTGRVHTTFNQAAAATGRLSSSDPNVQNIPVRSPEGRGIRAAFIAEPGFVLLSADYSQIELRVLAHLSGEPALLTAFEKGEDVHALTASGIFGVSPAKVSREQRAVGKTVNFATIYGQTAFGLSKQLSISAGEAAAYIDNYFRKYPAVAAYREQVLERCREEGMVTTLFGRHRYFPEIESTNPQARALAERMAFNTVFQGTAADIVKRAMLAAHAGIAQRSARSRMLLQVHDELVFEVPAGEVEAVKPWVREVMEGAAKLRCPLTVDVGVGPNWADAH